MLERVTDHVARGLAKLPDQYQKPRIRALLASWLAEFQEAEDALWQLLDATLDTATGARLEQWAALLGERRQGLGDVALRKVARARILANRSQGRDGDVVAMLAVFGVAFFVEDFSPAAVVVTLDAFPGDGLPPRIASLLRRTVGGGIGAQLVAPGEKDDEIVFALAEDFDETMTNDDAGLADAAQTQGGALAGVWE